MTVGGVDIAEGDGILVSLSAADRDPRLIPDPEVFDPRRPPSPHLAFGHGIHRCIGAELARMELRTAYPALLQRFPEIAMAADERTLPLRTTSIVYGVDALPVTLG
jgi:cytochrome P450